MTFGSLFAGIGGMDLGLERSGMSCQWQVEIDAYARRVLAKHWPGARQWGNIKTFIPDTTGERLGAWGPGRIAARRQRRARSAFAAQWSVDLIAGGFPCQDISYAGKGAGLAGKRSRLWHEFARVVRVLEPRYVLVENVSALLTRGLDAVLGTLASFGYDCEWACIPAAAVGAPHIRDRVFILAHRDGRSGESGAERPGRQAGPDAGGGGVWPAVGVLADADGLRQPQQKGGVTQDRRRPIHGSQQGVVSNAQRAIMERRPRFGEDAREELAALARDCLSVRGQWHSDPADGPEPRVGRMAHGIPHRVDRIRGLGNAVVPQVAEWIGRRIMALHQ
jgi:DNA (cytosine-5)-methyltransferase 1